MNDPNGSTPTVCPKDEQNNPNLQGGAEETPGYRLELYDNNGDVNVWLFDAMPSTRWDNRPVAITFVGLWRGHNQRVTFVIPACHSWALIPVDPQDKKEDRRWQSGSS